MHTVKAYNLLDFRASYTLILLWTIERRVSQNYTETQFEFHQKSIGAEENRPV